MVFAKNIPFADECATVHPKWLCSPPTQYFFAFAIKIETQTGPFCERTGIFFFFWDTGNKNHIHLRLSLTVTLPTLKQRIKNNKPKWFQLCRYSMQVQTPCCQKRWLPKKWGTKTQRFEHLCECAFVLSVLSWVIGFPQGLGQGMWLSSRRMNRITAG